MRNTTITHKCIVFLAILFVIFGFFKTSVFAEVNVQDEISKRNEEIQKIQQQISAFEREIQLNQGKASTLSSEISRLNATISKVQLEIQSLNFSIENTNIDIRSTEEQIFDAQKKITAHRSALATNLQAMYELDGVNLTQVLLANERLSDFFNNLNNVTEAQNTLRTSINAIQTLKNELESTQENLKGKKSELESLREIQAAQKNNLDQNKSTKASLLKVTKGEEQKFQELKKKGEKDIAALRSQVEFLLQQGLSLDDIVAIAQLRAMQTGIRPEFLLAIAEIETRTGKFLGTGNWQDDMVKCYERLGDIYYPNKKDYYYKRARTEEAAFIKITSQLGLDPDKQLVSAEPSYGCGGAVGPLQFLPSTWLGYQERVAAITGHNPPNPWNMDDAFTAAALKLADGGATSKTREGEIGAAKAYVGGSTKCSSNICIHYSNLALEKAEIIGQNL